MLRLSQPRSQPRGDLPTSTAKESHRSLVRHSQALRMLLVPDRLVSLLPMLLPSLLPVLLFQAMFTGYRWISVLQWMTNWNSVPVSSLGSFTNTMTDGYGLPRS